MKLYVPQLELLIYFCAWFGNFIYSIIKLYEFQNRSIGSEQLVIQKTFPDLVPGGKFISRLQDVSDYEWNSWKYFIGTFWITLIINFIVSEIIRQTRKSLLPYWYIISGAISILFHTGLKQLVLISLLPISYGFILYMEGKKIAIWCVSIAFLLNLIAINYNNYDHFFWHVFEDVTTEEVHLLIFSLAWTELRCISYCLDYIDHKKLYKNLSKSSSLQVTVDMLSYVYYLPVALTGPFILYEDFKNSFVKSNNELNKRVKIFLKDMIIYLSYTLLLNITLHYIYFHAMMQRVDLLSKWPLIALCGGLIWMALEFHLKYVIMYGSTTAFARLDNIKAPPIPRCVFRIHIYSQMWRYFDVGLYDFLLKYLYKPSYEWISKQVQIPKTLQKQLTSVLVYAFICLWHGVERHILLWIVLNYLGNTLENVARSFSKTELYYEFKCKVLRTEANEVRFIALLCTPLLSMYMITFLLLVGGGELATIYKHSVLNCSNFAILPLFIIVYCQCHLCMAVEDISSRTSNRN